jgi:hypothetical protein
MRNLTLFLFTLALSCFSYGAEKCNYDQSLIKHAKTYSFKSLLVTSAELSSEICLIKLNEKSDKSRLKMLANIWKETALTTLEPLKSAGVDLTEGVSLLADAFASAEPGTMVVNTVPRNFWRITIPKSGGSPITQQGLVEETSNTLCEDTTVGYGKTCMAVLEDFRVAVHATNADKNRLDMERALTNIGIYSKAWDRYFDDARSLTPWELALNTYFYKKELQKDSFVLPPKNQWFLFHPSVVIENVPEAIEGSQQKGAFSMEWVGFNRWNSKVPLGLSVVSTYADRQGVDNTRHGVMLHLYNDYSIGYTGIGGDDKGIFISMDLLKLTQSKESRSESYKKIVEQYQSQ